MSPDQTRPLFHPDQPQATAGWATERLQAIAECPGGPDARSRTRGALLRKVGFYGGIHGLHEIDAGGRRLLFDPLVRRDGDSNQSSVAAVLSD